MLGLSILLKGSKRYDVYYYEFTAFVIDIFSEDLRLYFLFFICSEDVFTALVSA